MNKFRIFETETFKERLSKGFRGQQKRIEKKLKSHIYPQLKNQPYFGPHIKKLRDYKSDTWRYKIGDYRFFYSVDEKQKIVFMLDILHRKDAY